MLHALRRVRIKKIAKREMCLEPSAGDVRPESLYVAIGLGRLERVVLEYHRIQLTIKFGSGDGAEAITGFEENDAGHQRGGEAEGVFACKC